MSYGSIPGCNEVQAKLQTTVVPFLSNKVVSSLISTFLNNPNVQADWDNMVSGIGVFLVAYPAVRVLITLSDGHVAYDSSKGVANTYLNYQAGLINENHNTRVSIMVSLLGSSGVGYEEKYSSSTGRHENYASIRMGLTTAKSLGCARVSIETLA